LPFVNAFLFLGAKPRFVTAMCRGRIWTNVANVGGGKKAKDAAKDSAASLHSVRTGHTCGPPAAKPPPGVQSLTGGGGAAVVADQEEVGAGGGQQAGQVQEGLLLLGEGLAMPHLTVSEIVVVVIFF
jgi:hypothetical protein